MERLEAENPPPSPALPALVWPITLLTIFFTVLRMLGEATAPAQTTIDCHHVAADDGPSLERCLDLRPDDVELMANLGAAHERAGEWERAELLYRRALAIDAEDGDMRVRLGTILLRRGDAAGARREAAAALALQPGRVPALDLIRRVDAAGHHGRDR